MSIIKKVLTYLAMEKGKFKGLYKKYCHPSNVEYGAFLARHGGYYSIGKNTSINLDVAVPDPAYVRIGDNCSLSSCTLLGHDGVIAVLNNVYGKRLDAVGKIDIKDNCFIGFGAIVMPGVTIGPNSVVAAGAVVTKDVLPGTVVAGVPAKWICSTDTLVERIEGRCSHYPWKSLIEQRDGAFDPVMEPQLRKMRIDYFYGNKSA